jgi:AraC-like DNA-binding protein
MLPGHLHAAGVRPEIIFQQAGMSPDDTASPALVRRSQIHHALALSARCLGQAEIGLALGRAADPGKLGPVGRAMAAGATPELCLRTQIELMPTMQSHAAIALVPRADEIVWTHRLPGDDETSWLLQEGAAAFNVAMLRHLIGEGWAPRHISFPHGCKGRRRTYEEHFQAPVSFGDQDAVRIHMKRTDLARPLRADRFPQDERTTLRPGHDAIRAYRPAGRDIEAAIGRMIDATLAHKPVTLPTAARILGLSTRTLQRRLDAHGTAFEQILDDRRRILATTWLGEGLSSVTDIAMRLGYSDPSHFNRAFRRWEGQSPTDYRQDRGAPAATAE